MPRTDTTERWADVPGFNGQYQASTHGNIRRVLGNGKYLAIKVFRRENNRTHKMVRVRLKDPEGRRREFPVLSIIAATWCPPPEGKVVTHRNGMSSDNSVSNVLFMSRSDIARKYAHRYNKKVVCKVDENGEPIEYYASIREAAKKNNVSERVVSTQCHSSVQFSRALGRLVFRFDT